MSTSAVEPQWHHICWDGGWREMSQGGLLCCHKICVMELIDSLVLFQIKNSTSVTSIWLCRQACQKWRRVCAVGSRCHAGFVPPTIIFDCVLDIWTLIIVCSHIPSVCVAPRINDLQAEVNSRQGFLYHNKACFTHSILLGRWSPSPSFRCHL